MKEIDYLSLDAHSLQTLLVVLEESSVSRAALRLGLTQSAVSHKLERLRTVFGDPLFVRSGRGIRATERALSLKEPLRAVLGELKDLVQPEVFDPAAQPLRFTVAANDFQRDLLFPDLLLEARDQGVDLRLRFIPSGVPDASMLRQGRCDMVVTPFPPDGPDILQAQLFEDQLACFYDPDRREAPATEADFLTAPYAEVRFANDTTSLVAIGGLERQKLPPAQISVPSFGALPGFIRGTDMIAAELSLMAAGPLKSLATAPLPFPTSPLTMYLAWHARDHTSQAHSWLRHLVERAAVRTVQH